jgi:hypothetical protein
LYVSLVVLVLSCFFCIFSVNVTAVHIIFVITNGTHIQHTHTQTASKNADSGNWSIATCTTTAANALTDISGTSLNLFTPGAPPSDGAAEQKDGNTARVTNVAATDAAPELPNALGAPKPAPAYVAPPKVETPAPVVAETPAAAPAPAAEDTPAPPAVPAAPASVTDNLFGDSAKADSAATSELFGEDDGAC